MEDYQENMRRVFRLIGCELGISNHVFPNTRTASNINVDDWVDRVSRITNDMYSPEGHAPAHERREVQEEEPFYSFNRLPPQRPNVRRGFIYTQLLEPRTTDSSESNTGITTEQIGNSTQLIQYDSSMNESRCPITWDQFEPGQNILRITNCRHIFGQQALTEWFQRHSICPVCRASVLQQPTVTNNETPTPSNGINMRANAQVNINTGNVLSNSTAISQILSGILTGVNGAANTETGYYESEFAFNVNDLLDAYTELIGTGSQTTTRTNPSSQTPTEDTQ
jgi:hypothetical protein